MIARLCRCQRQLPRLGSLLWESFCSALAQEPFNVGQLFLHPLVNVAVGGLCLMLDCSDLGRELIGDKRLLTVLLIHCGFHLIQPFFQLPHLVLGVHSSVTISLGWSNALWPALDLLLNSGSNCLDVITSEFLSYPSAADFGRWLISRPGILDVPWVGHDAGSVLFGESCHCAG